jgi:uncharacterized protein (TIGR02147 family)
MWIGEFSSYKAFLKAVIKTFPKNGRGVSARLAEHLGVAPIVISQILVRDRHFNSDQAVRVPGFFGFDEATTEYFIDLVSMETTHTREGKAFYKRRLDRMREESKKILSVVQEHTELSDPDKAVFYSNWYYTAIGQLTMLKGFQTVAAISEYFDLPPQKIAEYVSFLVSTGICIEEQGKIRFNYKSIYLGPDSPFLNNHRRNWRLKAIEKFPVAQNGDYFYTVSVTISEKDAEEIRKGLLEFIKSFSKRVADSEDEKLMCLNIDWFRF